MRFRLPRGFAWGFVDQSFSSLTNFGLTVLAGRLLGPDGLGVVAIGFAGYLLALTLLRALVSEPLVVRSSRLEERERRAATQGALTVTLVGAAAGAGLLALLGLALPGRVGHGLVLFSPWIVPALVQDFWRVVLFRDGRGGEAALNDLVWVVGMAAALPVALEVRTEWAVLGGWGFGAITGALLGVSQTRIAPIALSPAWRSWRSEEWPLGRWLAGGGGILAAGGQAVVLLLAALLGPAAVGGLRAAQTVFAPLTLLASAASLPGLPALSRAFKASIEDARALAAKISAALVALTFLYLLLVGAGRDALLRALFGREFVEYGSLVLPVGAQQLLLAAGTGFLLFLKASRRGRVLAWNRAVGTLSMLAFVALFGWLGGLVGAAWALAAGTAVITLFHASFSLWPAWSRARLVPPVLTRSGRPLREA